MACAVDTITVVARSDSVKHRPSLPGEASDGSQFELSLCYR